MDICLPFLLKAWAFFVFKWQGAPFGLRGLTGGRAAAKRKQVIPGLVILLEVE